MTRPDREWPMSRAWPTGAAVNTLAGRGYLRDAPPRPARSVLAVAAAAVVGVYLAIGVVLRNGGGL